MTRDYVVVMGDAPLAFNALAALMPAGGLHGIWSDKNNMGRSYL